MRTHISLLLIALYSTKIVGSIAQNLIIDTKPSNTTPKHKINNIFVDKKNICSQPIEKLEFNRQNDFYNMIDLVLALIFI
jgi:hypothetical protein